MVCHKLFNRRARCQHKSLGQEQYIMSNNSNKTDSKKPVSKKAETATPKADMKPVKGPSIEDIQKALDEQIGKFQRKSELIANREKFIRSKEKF